MGNFSNKHPLILTLNDDDLTLYSHLIFSHIEFNYLYENGLATFYLLILVLERLDALYKNI